LSLRKGVPTITTKNVSDLNRLKLWQLLLIGLRDLRKQEKSPGCKVNMAVWLDGCEACLAGCVMKWTCGLTHNWGYTTGWVRTLDYLRTGAVDLACVSMGMESNLNRVSG
jgi:hypothetical protein